MTTPRLAESVKCVAPECGRDANGPGAARDYCVKHYQRVMTHGSPDDPRPTTEERFFDKVELGHPLGCWTWTGGLMGSGDYGSFWVDGRTVFAHRWAWEFFRDRDIPEDKVIDHLCKNHQCVNPDHIEPVSLRENVRRGALADVTRRRHERNRRAAA